MKNAKKVLSYLLTLVILALFGWYVANNPDSFRSLFDIPVYLIVLLLAFSTLRLYNNGSFLKQILEFYKIKLSVLESYYIALFTAIANFFGPVVSGLGIRAVYLKKKYNFSYTDFASTSSGSYLIMFVASASIGLVSLALVQIQTGFFSPILYIIFGAWLAGSLILTEVRSLEGATDFVRRKAPPLHRVFKVANNIVKGWQLIKKNRSLFLRLNRINIYGFLMVFVIVYIEFKAIGVSVSLAALALYVSLMTLSMLVSLTPGAIGIREAILIFSQQLLGLNTDQILAIAVIDRTALFIVLVGGYLMFKTVPALKRAVKA